jgi:hypothetical protein
MPANNPCENAIRPFVVGRRNWLFADTVPGANASANLYSLLQTCIAIRAKRGLRFKRRYSQPVDRTNTQVLCDQIGTLEVYYSKQGYRTALRRVVVRDEHGKRITFLTNNTSLAPETVGELYRLRWQVELFFK